MCTCERRRSVPGCRYSGEGIEALLPALDAVFATASKLGVKDVVMGKAHRGRLALLVGLLEFPARKMFWKVRKVICVCDLGRRGGGGGGNL